MPEFYYNDGGAPRKAKALYYNDGGAVRTIKEAWYNDGGGPRKVFTAFDVLLSGGSFTYQVDGDGSAASSMSLQPDGTFLFSTGATPIWGLPTTPGIGVGYWVRFTRTSASTSGSGGSGTQSPSTGWLQLNVARSVSVTANKVSGFGAFTSNGTYTVEIATDAAGANIVATSTGYNLRAIAAAIS